MLDRDTKYSIVRVRPREYNGRISRGYVIRCTEEKGFRVLSIDRVLKVRTDAVEAIAFVSRDV